MGFSKMSQRVSQLDVKLAPARVVLKRVSINMLPASNLKIRSTRFVVFVQLHFHEAMTYFLVLNAGNVHK